MNYQKSKSLNTSTWKKLEHLLREVSEIKLAILSELSDSQEESVHNKKVKGQENNSVESTERLLISPKLSVYRIFRHSHACDLLNISTLSDNDTLALFTQLNKLLDLYNHQEVNTVDILSQYFPSDSQHQSILSSLDNVNLSSVLKLVSNLNKETSNASIF